MAVVAVQLHEAIRTAEIPLQVHRVIELDRSRIAAAVAQDRKFRVAAIERGNIRRVLCRSSDGVQIRVALRTSDVCSYREPQMAAMLQVARSARGRKCLVCVVKRGFVAGVARLIGGLGAERIRFLHVA